MKEIREGDFTVEETVAVISETEKGDQELTLMQKWPVRQGRPYQKKLPPEDASCNRTASDRYIFPYCKRRCGSSAGAFRKR